MAPPVPTAIPCWESRNETLRKCAWVLMVVIGLKFRPLSIPSPVTDMDEGDPRALWVKKISPFFMPAFAGLKLIRKSTLEEGGMLTLDGVTLKSAKVDDTPEIFKAPAPVLVTVTLASFAGVLTQLVIPPARNHCPGQAYALRNP